MKHKTLFKKFNFLLGLPLLLIILSVSCGGSSSDEVVVEGPSNLTLEVIIAGEDASNPNGDGSGMVTFNFSANNANTYKINFGDGEVGETSKNTLTHTFVGSGTKTFSVFISAYNGSKFISLNKSITIKINSGLLWADEFNYTGSPDSNKWGYNIGRGDNGWGNGEFQYYTSRTDNVIVENGVLKITAKKESYEGASYTSTRLLTQGKFDFKYGKVEVRAKLPIGVGTWPAIWMLGSNISTVGWPACGEVDIMEHWGVNHGTVQSALHTPSSFGDTSNHGAQVIPDVSTAFHIYGVEWTSTEMIFSVDGVEHYRYNPTTKNSSTWPFENQFIILNVAIGSTYHTVDPNFVSSTMEIDYVRVYQ